MSMTLRPTFSLNIGALSSDSTNALGGIYDISVERDIDIPIDLAIVTLADRSGISPEDSVGIELGFDGSEEKVFTGKVVSISQSLSRCRVQALGTMSGLADLRISNLYKEQNAGDIIDDLISRAGLTSGTIDNGVFLPIFAIDRCISAYAHAKGLADRLGFSLYSNRDGEINFRGLGSVASLDLPFGLGELPFFGNSLTYNYAQNIIEGVAKKKTPPWGSILVGGESPMSGRGDDKGHWLTLEDSSFQGGPSGNGSPEILVLDPCARTKDLADRFAEGHYAGASRNTHVINITVFGRSDLDLGDSITVEDCPDQLLNGNGFIRSITHNFSAQTGYVTHLSVVIEEGQ